MVADEEEGPLLLAEILLEGVVHMILGVNKQLPNQAQGIVNPIGVADFSCVNRSFNRLFFHILSLVADCLSCEKSLQIKDFFKLDRK